MTTKTIRSNDAEITMEDNPLGILLIFEDKPSGLKTSLTLNKDQAVYLKESIDQLMIERWETSDAKFSSNKILPHAPMVLEEKLGCLVEEYIELIAMIEEWDKHEPSVPLQQQVMTVAEWYHFSQERETAKIKLNNWHDMHEVLAKQLIEVTNCLGDAMPEAVQLVVPAFCGRYSIRALGNLYVNVSNIERYRLVLEPQRDDRPEKSPSRVSNLFKRRSPNYRQTPKLS